MTPRPLPGSTWVTRPVILASKGTRSLLYSEVDRLSGCTVFGYIHPVVFRYTGQVSNFLFPFGKLHGARHKTLCCVSL